MHTETVSPVKLVVRCIAYEKEAQWQAFSLEFGLAAQADSFPEVKKKLDAMIQDYLHDALVGEDREHAHELLSRRAPWWVYANYYLARVAGRNAKTFDEPWGLVPTQLPA